MIICDISSFDSINDVDVDDDDDDDDAINFSIDVIGPFKSWAIPEPIPY